MEAIKDIGENIHYAAPRLQSNPEIAAKAVGKSMYAALYPPIFLMYIRNIS